jgi:small-conductance mechanosensitive channel
VDSVLARRGLDIGMREAVGVILRYALVLLGALVILQSAGIDLTSLNVLVGAIGVGLGFGLQNITSNFFSGLILLFERPLRVGDRIEIAASSARFAKSGRGPRPWSPTRTSPPSSPTHSSCRSG